MRRRKWGNEIREEGREALLWALLFFVAFEGTNFVLIEMRGVVFSPFFFCGVLGKKFFGDRDEGTGFCFNLLFATGAREPSNSKGLPLISHIRLFFLTIPSHMLYRFYIM